MGFRNWVLGFGAGLLAMVSAATAGESMRLEWVIQGQFAGPLVALEKGYYKEAGIDMELNPAGPDLKPAITVAQGTDSFGIGHPNQVISARANGAPLVTVLQLGHKSASVYVARKTTGITSINDMKGHSVGLWFGGDEHEFLAMLRVAGIDHVGLGSDYDGITRVPKQLEDVSTYPLITQELLNRGYQPADIHKIMSGNILRVMRAAETVAVQMQAGK